MAVALQADSFIVGLSDHDPREQAGGPLHSSYQTCAEDYRPKNSDEVVDVTCTVPLYAWGRYLFVAVSATKGSFHLAGIEVEVYDGM